MSEISLQWGNRRWRRLAMFSLIALAAICLTFISSTERFANQKKQVAEFSTTPGRAMPMSADIAPPPQAKLETRLNSGVVGGVIGGVPGGVVQNQVVRHAETSASSNSGRMIVRNGALSLVVAHPAESVEKVIQVAQLHGGYVVSSQVSGQKQREAGQVTVRVPVGQFDGVRDELKKLAKTVDSEQISADDVTMQFSEDEATLRNYRAEEASYLEIMKRSGRIKDTLEVAEQLSDVRGRIERMAASLQMMQHQAEMTALTVELRTEPVAVSNEWRPLYALKLAWNEGLAALADYATTMISVVMYIPAVLAWGLTLALAVKLSWMLWLFGKRFFRPVKSEPVTS